MFLAVFTLVFFINDFTTLGLFFMEDFKDKCYWNISVVFSVLVFTISLNFVFQQFDHICDPDYISGHVSIEPRVAPTPANMTRIEKQKYN